MDKLKVNQINYRYLLVDNYKSLNLSENDLAVLLLVDNLLKEEPVLVTSELLSLKMTLDNKTIDNILVSLVNKGFLEYINFNDTNKLVTSIKPTYKKLQDCFIKSVLLENSLNENERIQEEVSNVYGTFEKEIGRTLTPIELEKIREWISQGISEKTIIDSLRECMSKNKKVTIRGVDRIIIKRIANNDLEKEGYSAVSEKWKKDIEETIDIASTKWVDE